MFLVFTQEGVIRRKGEKEEGEEKRIRKEKKQESAGKKGGKYGKKENEGKQSVM